MRRWWNKYGRRQGETQAPVKQFSTRKAQKPPHPLKNEESTEEKTKGHKRHIVVDTMRNLLAVVVHAANIHDTKSGILAARDAFKKYSSIQQFCANAGYRKTFEQDVSREPGLSVDISVRIMPEWEVLSKRWIVERSLAQQFPQAFQRL